MKRLAPTLVLTFLLATLLPSPTGAQRTANPYTQQYDLAAQIGRNTGAIDESCSPLANEPGYDDMAYLISSDCLYTAYSKDTTKDLIDIEYRTQLAGAWTYGNGTYANAIVMNGHVHPLVILTGSRKDRYKTLIIVTNSSGLLALREMERGRATLKQKLALPSRQTSAPTQGLGYIAATTLWDFGTFARVTADTFTYTIGKARLEIRIGSRQARINGRPVQIAGVPYSKDGDLLFPASALRLMGCTVNARSSDEPDWVDIACSGITTSAAIDLH